MSESREETRSDLEATIDARRELGIDHEQALVDGFLDRLETRLAERQERRPAATSDDARRMSFVLGMVSLGTGIPITAIAVSNGGLPGLIVAWLGIVLVNYVFSRR